MSAQARSAKRSLQDWLRQVATAILLAAFAVLVLQTTVHAEMGALIRHDHLTMTAVHHHCQPSDVFADDSRLLSSDHCGADADGRNIHGDSCEQFCAISVVLPGQLLPVSSVDKDFLFKIWSDRFGRTAPGLLRPPRSFAPA